MLVLERYKVRPEHSAPSPPGHGGTWPTGFAGTGWLVRDTVTGEIVFADAFRYACLEYVARVTA